MGAVSAEYRVKSKHNSTKEDAFTDCQAAFAWLRAHAGEHGIDPAKLSAGGVSAGGQCAMSILDTGVVKPASMVLFNPGGLAQAEPAAGMPPTILFFGSAKRLPVQLFVAKGQPHGFFNDSGDGTWHASTTYLADAFLHSQVYLPGKPSIAMPQGSKAALFDFIAKSGGDRKRAAQRVGSLLGAAPAVPLKLAGFDRPFAPTAGTGKREFALNGRCSLRLPRSNGP